jgi:hypothetical protein
MLATCVFSDAVDPNGVPVPVDVEYGSGIVRYVDFLDAESTHYWDSLPKPFTCKITPVA